MGITAPLCIECCAAGAFSTRTRGSMKPVFLRSCRDLCKYKMYKPALTATAKQILFVLAAEQIMRQADTQIFSLEGDDFLISVAAGLGMTGRGGASNPPPSQLKFTFCVCNKSYFLRKLQACYKNKIFFIVLILYCVCR